MQPIQNKPPRSKIELKKKKKVRIEHPGRHECVSDCGCPGLASLRKVSFCGREGMPDHGNAFDTSEHSESHEHHPRQGFNSAGGLATCGPSVPGRLVVVVVALLSTTHRQQNDRRTTSFFLGLAGEWLMETECRASKQASKRAI